jgi:hypothetical protein
MMQKQGGKNMERRKDDASLVINKMIVAFLGTLSLLMMVGIIYIQKTGGSVPGELLIAFTAVVGNLGGALNTNRPTVNTQSHPPQVQNENVERQVISSSENVATGNSEEENKEKPS